MPPRNFELVNSWTKEKYNLSDGNTIGLICFVIQIISNIYMVNQELIIGTASSVLASDFAFRPSPEGRIF